MVELIDDFFAEYPPAPGGSDKVDKEEADEVIEAIAKTVAELTSRQDGIFSQAPDQTAHAGDHEVRRRISSGRCRGHYRLSCTTLDLLRPRRTHSHTQVTPGYAGQAGVVVCARKADPTIQ
jgi:hypothetical protein